MIVKFSLRKFTIVCVGHPGHTRRSANHHCTRIGMKAKSSAPGTEF
jgi:hypothetical protein